MSSLSTSIRHFNTLNTPEVATTAEICVTLSCDLKGVNVPILFFSPFSTKTMPAGLLGNCRSLCVCWFHPRFRCTSSTDPLPAVHYQLSPGSVVCFWNPDLRPPGMQGRPSGPLRIPFPGPYQSHSPATESTNCNCRVFVLFN